MNKLTPVLLSLAFILSACTAVDTTGLSPDSTKMPKGSSTALVTVTEYGDLQCPACKAAHEILNKPLLEKYGTRIRFEFKQFPLAMHPYAMKAAMASECAADQGKFWEFLDLTYLKQADMSNTVFNGWADELSLDAALFDRCLSSGIKKKTVQADYKEGESLGVNSTPSYFVNSVRVNENTIQALSTAVDQALGNASAVPL
jgi:protein-disulfide isomerase